MKRKIFIEGKNPNERAYIGWQNQSLSLQGIRKGYKNSADDLVDIALSKGEIGRIDVLDTYIFPIIFLYRHSIEVSLKYIYFRIRGKMPEKLIHNLIDLWDMLDKEVFIELKNTEIVDDINRRYNLNLEPFYIEEKEKNIIRNLLKELQGKDIKGDVWRYLIDKGGNLYFTEWEYIDYRNLKNTLTWLYDELDGLYCYIDDMLSI
nr:MAG TPA_asm: hypothetical protein [Caudoviricetes sp.]